MTIRTLWQTPRSYPALVPDQVQVWRASLKVPAAHLDYFRTLLSEDELARAQRFVFEKDQHRFTVARGVLRLLLGAYLHTPPQEIVFGFGPQGKPFVQEPAAPFAHSFNLSHSGEWAAFAFARQGRIGVDIEFQRPLEDLHQLAATVFSERELLTLESLPNHQKIAAFYRCWTRKEAFIKAIGDGFSYPLARFDVTLAPDEPAQVLRVQDDPTGHERWRIETFSPAQDYAGAVIMDRKGHAPQFWNFDLGPFRAALLRAT